MIYIVLANKFWKWLTPYTYAIYLFHIIPVMLIMMAPHPLDIENGGVGEDNYGYLYIGKVAGISFIVSCIIGVILYWLLEYPMMLFRYKYIRPKYNKMKIKVN